MTPLRLTTRETLDLIDVPARLGLVCGPSTGARMAKADPVTWNFIRYRLTDPVSGVDNWRAEAFGLLVAERFYPDLVHCCRNIQSNSYGFFRNRLNRAWDGLRDPSAHQARYVSDRDLHDIAAHIPDNRVDGATGARAIAAGTICLHLARFLQSGDRNDIARLAAAAYAGVVAETDDVDSAGDGMWPTSIPFDEIGTYDALVAGAAGVRSELLLQDADLSFVEILDGTLDQRCTAVLRRAFSGQVAPTG